MSKILSDYDEKVVERQVRAILLSPQGRDLGRWFLTERGKGAEADLGKVIREVQEVEAKVIRDLYAAEAPIHSR
jgi:hypothetical protein